MYCHIAVFVYYDIDAMTGCYRVVLRHWCSCVFVVLWYCCIAVFVYWYSVALYYCYNNAMLCWYIVVLL